MENKYQDYRPGNLVRYAGLGVSDRPLATIVRVIDDKTLEIEFLPTSEWPDSNRIKASVKDITNIKLRENNLIQLDFKKAKDKFFRDSKIIRPLTFIVRNNQVDFTDFRGFNIIEDFNSEGKVNTGTLRFKPDGEIENSKKELPSKDDVNNLLDFTTPVNQIHTLQNYWKLNFNIDLDISKLTFDTWQ